MNTLTLKVSADEEGLVQLKAFKTELESLLKQAPLKSTAGLKDLAASANAATASIQGLHTSLKNNISTLSGLTAASASLTKELQKQAFAVGILREKMAKVSEQHRAMSQNIQANLGLVEAQNKEFAKQAKILTFLQEKTDAQVLSEKRRTQALLDSLVANKQLSLSEAARFGSERAAAELAKEQAYQRGRAALLQGSYAAAIAEEERMRASWLSIQKWAQDRALAQEQRYQRGRAALLQGSYAAAIAEEERHLASWLSIQKWAQDKALAQEQRYQHARAALAQGAYAARIRLEEGGLDAGLAPAVVAKMSDADLQKYSRAIDATDNLTKSNWKLHSALRGVGGAAGALWMTYGELLPLMAGYAAAATAIKGVKLAAEFEYTTVYTIAAAKASGDYSESLETLRDKLLGVKDVSDGPEVLATATKELVKAGFTVSEAVNEIAYMSKLASVAQEDLTQTTKAVASQYRAWNAETVGAARGVTSLTEVADKLAYVSLKTQVDIGTLSDMLSHTSELAIMTGMSFDELLAALGYLSNLGIKGTQAATSLRTAIERLQAPTKEAAKMMRAIGFDPYENGRFKSMEQLFTDLGKALEGLSDQDRMKALDAFFALRSMKGGVGMLKAFSDSLKKGGEGIRELVNEIKTASGTVESIYAQLSVETKEEFKKLAAAVQGELIKAFDDTSVKSLIKTIKRLVEEGKVRTLVKLFADGTDAIIKTTDAVANLALVITPFTNYLNTLPSWMVGSAGVGIVGGLLFGPQVGLVLAGLSAAVALTEKIKGVQADAVRYSSSPQKGTVLRGVSTLGGVQGSQSNALTLNLSPAHRGSWGSEFDKALLIESLRFTKPSHSASGQVDVPSFTPPSKTIPDLDAVKEQVKAINFYWSEVKFLDPDYYAYRLGEIKKLIEASGANTVQAARMENKLIEDLNNEQVAYYEKRFKEIGKISSEAVKDASSTEAIAAIYDVVFEKQYAAAVELDQKIHELAEKSPTSSQLSALREAAEVAMDSLSDTLADKTADIAAHQSKVVEAYRKQLRAITKDVKGELEAAITSTDVSEFYAKQREELIATTEAMTGTADDYRRLAELQIELDRNTAESENLSLKKQKENREWYYNLVGAADETFYKEVQKRREDDLRRVKDAHGDVAKAQILLNKKWRDEAAATARSLAQAANDWSKSAIHAAEDYLNKASDTYTSLKDAFSRAFQSMEDVFVDFVRTGKLSFKSLADSIIADLVRIATRVAITTPLVTAMFGSRSVSAAGLPGSVGAAGTTGGGISTGSLVSIGWEGVKNGFSNLLNPATMNAFSLGGIGSNFLAGVSDFAFNLGMESVGNFAFDAANALSGLSDGFGAGFTAGLSSLAVDLLSGNFSGRSLAKSALTAAGAYFGGPLGALAANFVGNLIFGKKKYNTPTGSKGFTLTELAGVAGSFDQTKRMLSGTVWRTGELNRASETSLWYHPIAEVYSQIVGEIQNSFNQQVQTLAQTLPETFRDQMLASLASQDYASMLRSASEGRWGTAETKQALEGAAKKYAESLSTVLGKSYAEAFAAYLSSEGAAGVFGDTKIWGLLTDAAKSNAETLMSQIVNLFQSGETQKATESLNRLTGVLSSLQQAMAPITEIIETSSLTEYELQIRNINKQFDGYAAQLKAAGVDLEKYTELEVARGIALGKVNSEMRVSISALGDLKTAIANLASAQTTGALLGPKTSADMLDAFNAKWKTSFTAANIGSIASGSPADLEFLARLAAPKPISADEYATRVNDALGSINTKFGTMLETLGVGGATVTRVSELFNVLATASSESLSMLADTVAQFGFTLDEVTDAVVSAYEAINEANTALNPSTAGFDVNTLLSEATLIINQLANETVDAASVARANLDTATKDLKDAFEREKDSIRAVFDGLVETLRDKADLLERSFAAEKERLEAARTFEIDRLNELVNSTSKTVSMLESATSSLASALKNMEGETVEENRMRMSESLQNLRDILSAARGGDMSGFESDKFSDSLDVLTRDNKKYYASFEDYQTDFLKSKLTIMALNAVAREQLTTEERVLNNTKQLIDDTNKNFDDQIAALNEQLDALLGVDKTITTLSDAISQYQAAKTAHDEFALDAQLDALDAQLNALLGIDTSIMSLADAIASYSAAVQQTIPATPGGSSTSTPDAAIGWREGVSNAWPRDQGLPSLPPGTNAPPAPGNSSAYSYDDIRTAVNNILNAGGTARDVYDAAAAHGVSGSTLDAAMGWGEGVSNAWAREHGLPPLPFTYDDIRTAVNNILNAGGTARDVYDAAVAYGVSASALDAAMGWGEGVSNAWAREHGLPQFALGTNAVPEPMIARFNGGEEITPAPYVDLQRAERAEQTDVIKKMVDEIRTLREELRAAQYQIAKNTGETTRVLEKWDYDGIPVETP